MTDKADRAIRHVVIRGRVQGVGYRAWAAEAAYRENIEGWVRNRRDGTVEAVFAGAPAAVASMIEACRQGPFGARVDEIYELDARGDVLAMRQPGENFSLLPTV